MHNDIPVLMTIPLDRKIGAGLARGDTLLEIYPEYGDKFRELYDEVDQMLRGGCRFVTQLVILSGKGGTGKTNLSAAFSHLHQQEKPGNKAILVDADVDAANLALLLEAEQLSNEIFIGGAIARIDPVLCNGCGRCQEVCRYEAVSPGWKIIDRPDCM